MACIGLALACGHAPTGELPSVDCSAAPVPAFGDVHALARVCSACHSADKSGGERNGAPSGVDFDDFESAAVNAEQAAVEVQAGRMPPTFSSLELTPAQRDELFAWAMCGTP